jgi:hypothetical protein
MLTLSKDNPSPFIQPFLELQLKGDGAKRLSPGGMLLIDVGGEIEKYITDDHEPTELLVDLCRGFAKAGAVVSVFNRYRGSAGPHIIMRHGALFYRMIDVENPPEEVLAYEYRAPKYNGRR